MQQEVSFSPRFESRMKKLLHRAAMTPQQVRRHMAGQVAIVLLMFTLAFASLMSVEAIRVPVMRFFTEVHETFTRIVFGTEEDTTAFPEAIEQVYLPDFIPEGFTLEYEVNDPAFIVLSYAKEEETLGWMQYCVGQAFYVDTEGTALEEFTQNGITYLYYENKGQRRLIWEQYGYTFICDGKLSRDQLLLIAESIKENN